MTLRQWLPLYHLVLGFAVIASIANAAEMCKPVTGHINSEVVAVLPDGSPCPSPIGFCTVGRLNGGIQGDFFYVAEQLIDNPDSMDVEFVVGTIELETSKGNLTMQDASVVSFAPDGSGASVSSIIQGTGELTGASGRLRAIGILINGCVDCDYRGELCVP